MAREFHISFHHVRLAQQEITKNIANTEDAYARSGSIPNFSKYELKAVSITAPEVAVILERNFPDYDSTWTWAEAEAPTP